ncbi:MAG TPA: SAM-dependent methyltransferase [Polyangia bacterium]|nr:SAM-dependent methyltransferase [Polyangia bacterium]
MGPAALSSPGVPAASTAAPTRTVHHADALAWLRVAGPLAGASVVTSLPDASELPALGFDGWRRWFEEAAALTMRSVPDEGVAIFFQSDVRHAGLWVDKGAMVARAAERAGMGALFHKIVCRRPPGTLTRGRASYSHLLGFARVLRPTLRRATPDLLPDGGFQPGVKSMGVLACVDACRFVVAETTTRTIVDPFCGLGTVLAVANALGLDAVGVDLSARMCKRARRLAVTVDR